MSLPAVFETALYRGEVGNLTPESVAQLISGDWVQNGHLLNPRQKQEVINSILKLINDGKVRSSILYRDINLGPILDSFSIDPYTLPGFIDYFVQGNVRGDSQATVANNINAALENNLNLHLNEKFTQNVYDLIAAEKVNLIDIDPKGVFNFQNKVKNLWEEIALTPSHPLTNQQVTGTVRVTNRITREVKYFQTWEDARAFIDSVRGGAETHTIDWTRFDSVDVVNASTSEVLPRGTYGEPRPPSGNLFTIELISSTNLANVLNNISLNPSVGLRVSTVQYLINKGQLNYDALNQRLKARVNPRSFPRNQTNPVLVNLTAFADLILGNPQPDIIPNQIGLVGQTIRLTTNIVILVPESGPVILVDFKPNIPFQPERVGVRLYNIPITKEPHFSSTVVNPFPLNQPLRIINTGNGLIQIGKYNNVRLLTQQGEVTTPPLNVQMSVPVDQLDNTFTQAQIDEILYGVNPGVNVPLGKRQLSFEEARSALSNFMSQTGNLLRITIPRTLPQISNELPPGVNRYQGVIAAPVIINHNRQTASQLIGNISLFDLLPSMHLFGRTSVQRLIDEGRIDYQSIPLEKQRHLRPPTGILLTNFLPEVVELTNGRALVFVPGKEPFEFDLKPIRDRISSRDNVIIPVPGSSDALIIYADNTCRLIKNETSPPSNPVNSLFDPRNNDASGVQRLDRAALTALINNEFVQNGEFLASDNELSVLRILVASGKTDYFNLHSTIKAVIRPTKKNPSRFLRKNISLRTIKLNSGQVLIYPFGYIPLLATPPSSSFIEIPLSSAGTYFRNIGNIYIYLDSGGNVSQNVPGLNRLHGGPPSNGGPPSTFNPQAVLGFYGDLDSNYGHRLNIAHNANLRTGPLGPYPEYAVPQNGVPLANLLMSEWRINRAAFTPSIISTLQTLFDAGLMRFTDFAKEPTFVSQFRPLGRLSNFQPKPNTLTMSGGRILIFGNSQDPLLITLSPQSNQQRRILKQTIVMAPGSDTVILRTSSGNAPPTLGGALSFFMRTNVSARQPGEPYTLENASIPGGMDYSEKEYMSHIYNSSAMAARRAGPLRFPVRIYRVGKPGDQYYQWFIEGPEGLIPASEIYRTASDAYNIRDIRGEAIHTLIVQNPRNAMAWQRLRVPAGTPGAEIRYTIETVGGVNWIKVFSDDMSGALPYYGVQGGQFLPPNASVLYPSQGNPVTRVVRAITGPIPVQGFVPYNPANPYPVVELIGTTFQFPPGATNARVALPIIAESPIQPLITAIPAGSGAQHLSQTILNRLIQANQTQRAQLVNIALQLEQIIFENMPPTTLIGVPGQVRAQLIGPFNTFDAFFGPPIDAGPAGRYSNRPFTPIRSTPLPISLQYNAFGHAVAIPGISPVPGQNRINQYLNILASQETQLGTRKRVIVAPSIINQNIPQGNQVPLINALVPSTSLPTMPGATNPRFLELLPSFDVNRTVRQLSNGNFISVIEVTPRVGAVGAFTSSFRGGISRAPQVQSLMDLPGIPRLPGTGRVQIQPPLMGRPRGPGFIDPIGSSPVILPRIPPQFLEVNNPGSTPRPLITSRVGPIGSGTRGVGGRVGGNILTAAALIPVINAALPTSDRQTLLRYLRAYLEAERYYSGNQPTLEEHSRRYLETGEGFSHPPVQPLSIDQLRLLLDLYPERFSRNRMAELLDVDLTPVERNLIIPRMIRNLENQYAASITGHVQSVTRSGIGNLFGLSVFESELTRLINRTEQQVLQESGVGPFLNSNENILEPIKRALGILRDGNTLNDDTYFLSLNPDKTAYDAQRRDLAERIIPVEGLTLAVPLAVYPQREYDLIAISTLLARINVLNARINGLRNSATTRSGEDLRQRLDRLINSVATLKADYILLIERLSQPRSIAEIIIGQVVRVLKEDRTLLEIAQGQIRENASRAERERQEIDELMFFVRDQRLNNYYQTTQGKKYLEEGRFVEQIQRNIDLILQDVNTSWSNSVSRDNLLTSLSALQAQIDAYQAVRREIHRAVSERGYIPDMPSMKDIFNGYNAALAYYKTQISNNFQRTNGSIIPALTPPSTNRETFITEFFDIFKWLGTTLPVTDGQLNYMLNLAPILFSGIANPIPTQTESNVSNTRNIKPQVSDLKDVFANIDFDFSWICTTPTAIDWDQAKTALKIDRGFTQAGKPYQNNYQFLPYIPEDVVDTVEVSCWDDPVNVSLFAKVNNKTGNWSSVGNETELIWQTFYLNEWSNPTPLGDYPLFEFYCDGDSFVLSTAHSNIFELTTSQNSPFEVVFDNVFYTSEGEGTATITITDVP